MKRPLLALALSALLSSAAMSGPLAPGYDVVIRGGTILDGSGGPGWMGDVAVRGDRIVAVAATIAGRGKIEIDAGGRAVAPGFVNMLAHPEESLIADGRALSDIRQGVTLEVLGEISMGPLTAGMKTLARQRQGDIRYPVTWSTLGGYMEMLEKKGIAPNVASFVGAAEARVNLLGEDDVQPTPAQLDAMRGIVRRAMEEGALGVTTALIYAPATYAKTAELAALAGVSAQCGGIYSAHMRSEGDRLDEAVAETIGIAEASGAPAHIYHFKQAGRTNWDKIDREIATIAAARARGVRITSDMYLYTAGATGLDAAMPSWAQAGGLEAWIERLNNPAQRARIAAEMKDPHPGTWENLYAGAGADGMLLLAFKNPKLKPLTGRTLADVAKERGKSPEETAMDLVAEDGSRVGVAYFLMDEANVRKGVAQPWMMFGSDEAAPAPEGVFLLANNHPRAYGNFARLLAKYVRDERVITLPEAVRRLTSLPADTLSLKDRGRLRVGGFADIVVFDPATVQDHATFEKPAQLATGVDDVLVNGRFALRGGRPTGAKTGRFVRGRAWTGAPGGGCRRNAAQWRWAP